MEEAARQKSRPSDEKGTRERILRVAEQLFAEHGFNGVSVRTLTAAANVNLAGVSYYFGSKEGLLAAIYDSHCRPMAEERLRLLSACAAGTGTGTAARADHRRLHRPRPGFDDRCGGRRRGVHAPQGDART